MYGSPRIATALTVCAVLSGMMVLAGCAGQDPAPAKPAVSVSQESYSGPYPLGVGVHLNGVKFTLKSVEVSDVEWPYQDPATAAPDGSRWAYVEFSFEGTGTNPAPGGGFFYPELRLIADGKTTSVDRSSGGGDMEAPPGVAPSEWLSFMVPESAHSAVLLVTPAFAETQTVGFRLW